MNLNRIVLLALTSFLGQGISIITQLLIPPFFLHYYANGVECYGEWIALSASINYLGTLNYGVQTFANNQTAILYNNGEIDGAKAVQASALRLLLVLIGLFAVCGLIVFLIPIAHLLKLKHVTSWDASVTLYILIVQMALSMLLSLLTNSYMVMGELHRGNYWMGAQRLTTVLLMSVAIFFKSSFPMLALVQLIAMVPFFILVLMDIKRRSPILLPSLSCGSWRQSAALLKPSGHFGLIALGGFMTWQGPIILIQRALGPAAVAVFALVRVVFQMSRQILSIASSMIGQDITILVGKKDLPQLRRLYDLSERVVLLLIPIVSIGSLLLCPVLFSVWLHKRDFYQPTLCILMAIVSAILGIKEHKTQFQSSSNKHEDLSLLILIGYTAMLIASLGAMNLLGLNGFMLTWITWEVIQTFFVVRLNGKLFPAKLQVSFGPLIRLVLFMSAAFSLAVWPAYEERIWPLPQVVLVATAAVVILGFAAYCTFGLNEVWLPLQRRLRRRLPIGI